MKEDLNLFPLDPETFRSWLAEQPSSGIVGKVAVDTECPLARFLHDLYGGEWAVHFEKYERFDNDLLFTLHEWYSLPSWAMYFLYQVDWFGSGVEVPICAGEALPLLDAALAESVSDSQARAMLAVKPSAASIDMFPSESPACHPSASWKLFLDSATWVPVCGVCGRDVADLL